MTRDYEKYIPVHPVRNKIYHKFYDLLCKYNLTLTHDSQYIISDIMKMALNIERGIFNYTMRKYDINNQTSWNSVFQTYYMNRCVSIYSNLNYESCVKNVNLIKRLFNREFNEYELTFFTTKELFPEKYDTLSKLYNLEKINQEDEKEMHDGIFQCKKCKSHKTSYYEMQTRSADEPMTCFVTCHNCGKKWKS